MLQVQVQATRIKSADTSVNGTNALREATESFAEFYEQENGGSDLIRVWRIPMRVSFLKEEKRLAENFKKQHEAVPSIPSYDLPLDEDEIPYLKRQETPGNASL